MFRVILRLAKIASAVDAASSQLLSGAHKTYRRNFGVGQSRVSFERDGVFAVRFEADLPDAFGFGARDGSAGGLNPGDALTVRRAQFEDAGDIRTQGSRRRRALLSRKRRPPHRRGREVRGNVPQAMQMGARAGMR